MDNAFRVSRIEGVGNLDSKGQYCLALHRTPCDAVLQRHPIEKLHRDEGVAIGGNIKTEALEGQLQCRATHRGYCSFAYSALACFRMGMSGSASFQRARKS